MKRYKRITSLLILLFASVQWAGAQDYQQMMVSNSLNGEVKIVQKFEAGTSLQKVLSTIKGIYNVNFVFESNLLRNKTTTETVIVHSNRKLYPLLDDILAGLALDYKKAAYRTFVIVAKEEIPIKKVVQAQVSGTVTDAQTGEPMAGVNILGVGTSVGTTTDANGHYSLTVYSLQDTLRFSFIGYQTQLVPINGRTEINIELKPKVVQAQELIVIGYGKERKEDLTGAVSVVTGEEIENAPANSLAEALTGRLAGVSITRNQGGPGTDYRIRIRGTNSITQGNDPLIIVDGVTVPNALSILSPSEIKSISVLKDAASTAIYGARGSNGVIVITTKSGQATPLKVSYSGSVGYRSIINKLDVMEPYEFIKYQYFKHFYGGYADLMQQFRSTYGRYSDIDIYKEMNVVDWQKRVFGGSHFQQNHKLTFSGGLKQGTYYITLNHLRQDGLLIGSAFKRSNLTFKYNHTPEDEKFSFGLNLRYNRMKLEGQGTASTGANDSDYLQNAVQTKPYIAPGQRKLSERFILDYTRRTDLINPVLLAHNQIRNRYTENLLLNGSVGYDFTDRLTLQARIGWNYEDTKDNQFNGPATGVARHFNMQPVIKKSKGNDQTLTVNTTLHYTRTFNKNHTFDLILGQQILKSTNENFELFIKWLPPNISAERAFANIQRANPPSGATQQKPSNFQSKATLWSYFGRLDYTYDNKYLATFTFRRSGSSKFPKINRWAFFPAASVAWRISEEPFLSDISWLSSLKLRVSYGSTGNNGIDNQMFRTMMVSGRDFSYAYRTSLYTGVGPKALANNLIQWERTVTKNIGLDFALFDNRIRGSIDAYIEDSNHLLLQKKIPVLSGFTEQIQNVGSTRNIGLGLQIGAEVVKSKDFGYSFNLNISANRNTIKSLGKDAAGNPLKKYYISSGWAGHLEDFVVAVGKPVGTYYGYVTDGFYKINDFYYSPSEGYTLKSKVPNDSEVALGNQPPQPGDLKLKDLNGDGKITPEGDKKTLGSAQPLFHGGLSQQFSYKNFYLSIMLTFSYGNEEYNANKIKYTTSYLYNGQNMLEMVTNRFRYFNKEGVKITKPLKLKKLNKDASFWIPPGGQYFLKSSAVEDASYLKISNVTLSYSFPQRIIQNISLSKLSVYVTVHNLWTFTGYSGYNPVASTRGNTLTRGVDYASYPLNRFILAGINITF